MNMIFLRGAVPPKHEHPEKLLYNKIENCEDVWTQLFYYLVKLLGGKGTLIYQGGSRLFEASGFFTERWVPSITKYVPEHRPDVIICRGGFDYYDGFVKRFPKAAKVYYGAGRRFYPQSYCNYQLFLVDSKKQLQTIRDRGKRAEMFIKPAATMFRPLDCRKKFDVCFMILKPAARKRHELLLKSLSRSNYDLLVIGGHNKKMLNLARQLKVNVHWAGWVPRRQLAQMINQCKVGVCCSTHHDSCPRVIPEYLACGLPIVVTKDTSLWYEKYVTKETGVSVGTGHLLDGITKALRIASPIRYYRENLSLPVAAQHLAKLVSDI